MHNKKLLQYINESWQDLTVSIPDDNDTHLRLPHPFVAPSSHRVENFVFREQFYWDTYFTIVGLVGTEQHDLAVGMVENLYHLLDRLGYVPNSNNRVHLGRSQPPLLSQMTALLYDNHHNKAWLNSAYDLLVGEYFDVWLSEEHPHHRNVHRVLSRYYHENQTHHGAEDESGWDYTPRFEERALDILPIDLNSFLHIYELDLEFFANELGLASDAADWRHKADMRKRTINDLMWDEDEGMYYEYDFVRQERLRGWSLAAFVPLFAEIPTPKQADRLLEKLKYFETDYGLSTTPKDHEPVFGKQWAAPNGWAPLHYLVVEGLEKYGHHDWARQIAVKWVHMAAEKFEQTGMLYEKYNVVDPSKPPTSAVYPDQNGFAWTNAITAYFINRYH